MANQYILTIDAGSTGVKATLFDKSGSPVSRSYHKTEVELSPDGRIETNPEYIFKIVVETVNDCIKQSNIPPKQIISLGITNQRGTFTCWDKRTGKPLHPFIGWADLRGTEVCVSANTSWKTRIIRGATGLLYLITRDPRFLTMNKFNLKNNQATPKMCWVWKYLPEVQECYKRGDLCVGTLDSWLVYKLTGGKVHATDYSNASATGCFDPYALNWSGVIAAVVYPYKLPPWDAMPQIKQTADNYGSTLQDLFGASIPINVVIGDQQAALFGQCCFNVGDAKCTLGTGGFLDINTGSTCQASYGGLYPLVAWKINGKVTYCMEGTENSAGIAMEWLKTLGLVDKIEQLEEVANRVKNNGGVYFVPALYGLSSPYWDPKARGMWVGMTAYTQKNHLVRATIESLAFRTNEIVDLFTNELLGGKKIKSLKVDGGVTKNNLICQSIADFAAVKVDRPENLDMTSLGVAYLAGLHVGFWKDQDELKSLRSVEVTFEPKMEEPKRQERIYAWKQAITRSLYWPEEGEKVNHKSAAKSFLFSFAVVVAIFGVFIKFFPSVLKTAASYLCSLTDAL